MRSIELFSGAGGLAIGLEKAGFESAGLVEFNRDACETLRTNRPEWNVIEDDVRNVDFGQFSKIDLVAGGPPCQPFSMGGKAKGKKDHRDMFPEAVRAVRELHPSAFVFENVRGLVRPAFQEYVEFIRLQLSYPEFVVDKTNQWEESLRQLRNYQNDLSISGPTYDVSINLVDAADYGVPQRRHRVFFVGFRNDIEIRWQLPEQTHSQDELIREKFVTGQYWRHHMVNRIPAIPERIEGRINRLRELSLFSEQKRWRTVRDAIVGLGEPIRGRNLQTDHRFQTGARVYPGHTGSPIDEPSKALKAGDHGVPGGENMIRHPNGKVRYFTIREAARIQTFPDDWIFSGSWTETMRQLGNAVPVELARIVVESVGEQISKNGSRRAFQPTRQDESWKEHRGSPLKQQRVAT